MDYGKPILAVTLCEKLQINKSTMSRLLKTLKDEDFISYLEKSNEIIANDISNKTNQSTKIELLIKSTKVLLEEISEKTNECAYLGIFDDYKVSYINQIDLSNQELKTRNNIGVQVNLHTSALGKSILAFGNYDLEKIKFNQFTSNTITNIENLKKEILEVKNKGYSIDNKEYQDGMCCVAVPLFNKENILIGAVGISGNSMRLKANKLSEIGEIISDIVSKYSIVY
ncbi:IclR family transcriptional regulator [Arcobacter suis]|uniref:IclR family transcriptional regulator n=1 Tax=Arcobacter suis TaxID=1278212 RepID=UPI001867D965|nr:IclR family transcriptional regulator C-terminal domain-containing protein [Arcobacter suis]